MSADISASRAGLLSLRIIAAGVVLGFCYFAASVVITLLLSVLLAYFLDPLVELLERFRVHRIVGSLLAVLLMLGVVVAAGWSLLDRVNQFADDWPKYRGVLRDAVAGVERRIMQIEQRVLEITPHPPGARSVRIGEEFSVRGLLLRGLGSIYVFLLVVSFLPFLVFFMLAAKHDLWHTTMQLFPPAERTRVKRTLENLSAMLRSFILGNMAVALILGTASSLFFWALGLDHPVLTGLTSGLLNLVPYVGAVLSWVPVVIVGLAKMTSWGRFFFVAGVLLFFHLLAINLLMPAFVGRQVHLNAVAVTVALLFWGWMWGGLGLILAIPITATIKVVCDHVEPWQPLGRWLGG